MTIYWKAVEQYFTVCLFFDFPLVCNFRKFDNFRCGKGKGSGSITGSS